MTERTFDRVVKFDEKSRSYPLRRLLVDKGIKDYKPRSYTWNTYDNLDQGREGACVGFGWAHELMARPVVYKGLTPISAKIFYNDAKKIDSWEGEDYEGTSVIAGAKAIKNLNYMDEYRWIFADADDIVKTLGYFGPMVLGVYWHENMFEPDTAGFIRPTGEILGGHCLLAKGILINAHDIMLSRVELQNSWGFDWGVGGDCYITLRDLIILLQNDGEVCVPTRRKKQ